MDGQRAGGYSLRGVPQQQPHHRMMTAGEVDAGNLQITAVDVTLVERDGAVDGYLLEAAAPHAVVGAGNYGVRGFVGEADGAVLVVVGDSPAAGACLHAGLIAIGIKLRQEEAFIILHNAGVLVELISRIDRRFLALHGKIALTDCVCILCLLFHF